MKKIDSLKSDLPVFTSSSQYTYVFDPSGNVFFMVSVAEITKPKIPPKTADIYPTKIYIEEAFSFVV